MIPDTRSPRKSVHNTLPQHRASHKTSLNVAFFSSFPSCVETHNCNSNQEWTLSTCYPTKAGNRGRVLGKGSYPLEWGSAGSGSHGKDPRKVQGGVFQATSWADAPPLFLSRPGVSLISLRAADKEHSEGERLGSPEAWPLLPPPLSSNPGCFQALSDACDSRSGVGSCLPNPALPPDVSCCTHTRTCTITHRQHSQTPKHTGSLARGQAHTEIQVNSRRHICTAQACSSWAWLFSVSTTRLKTL